MSAKQAANNASRGARLSRLTRLTPLARQRLRLLGLDTPKNLWMAGNVGKALGTVDHKTLKPCLEPVTSDSGFELVCSYNWRRPPRGPFRSEKESRAAQGPHIIVPGQAPRVMVHQLPILARARPRHKTQRDFNMAYMPQWPFEPVRNFFILKIFHFIIS